jgi:TonB family protein
MLIPALGLLVLLAQTPVPPVVAADEAPLTHWQKTRTSVHIDTVGPVIQMSGARGWTRATAHAPEFDFILRLRYRLVTADAAGAVIVRAWEGTRDIWPRTGYRIALPGSASKGKEALPLRAYSSSVAMVSNVPPIERLDAEHWYDLEITCLGNHTTVRVDGRLAAEGDGTERPSGTLGLELDRGAIEFRDMRLSGLRSPAWLDALRIDKSFTGQNPTVKHAVKPRYPSRAQQEEVQGVVILEAIVDENGRVTATRVVKSVSPDLDEEALGAARQWRFTPAVLDGHPIRVIVTLELEFRLGHFTADAHAMPSGPRPASSWPAIVSDFRSITVT